MNRGEMKNIVNRLVNMVKSTKVLIFSMFYKNLDFKKGGYLKNSNNSNDELTNIFCKFKKCPHFVLVVNKW